MRLRAVTVCTQHRALQLVTTLHITKSSKTSQEPLKLPLAIAAPLWLNQVVAALNVILQINCTHVQQIRLLLFSVWDNLVPLCEYLPSTVPHCVTTVRQSGLSKDSVACVSWRTNPDQASMAHINPIRDVRPRGCGAAPAGREIS